MNFDKLEKKCKTLEKVIRQLSPIYKQTNDHKQKDYLETIVGAAIWYLPTGQNLYSGKISEKAIAEVKNGKKWSQLTKEHIFPRKKAGRDLLKNLNKESLQNAYINQYGRYHLVTSKENKELVKFQKENDYNWEKAYKEVKIKLFNKKIEEIKTLY